MRLIIQLFSLLLAPAARRFQRALNHPQAAQAKVQREICDRLTASPYGQALGVRSVDDWAKVPIVTYDDLAPWIERDRQTPILRKTHPLTPEPILFHEKTSGSRGPAKWIPYTRSLRRSFSQMFCIWAHDLLTYGPRFRTGKIYFCISPHLGKHPEATIQKTGLTDDSDYLDGWLRSLLSPFLVTLRGLNAIQDPTEFKHQLCLTLLAATDLEIISIWSPSFLKVQLDYIETHREALIPELQDRLDLDRLALLRRPQIPWTQLWPELKLISCWDSVNSADQADWLRSRFPGVLVQGKGLLATEAPMTIPLIQAQGCVPVLDEVFFEFEDETRTLSLLHELKPNQTYSLILSQKSGLYRYRMGDRVRVTHFYRNTPCLEFIGRHPSVSDLVGEKLHEDFVQTVLAQLPLHGASFKSLMPVQAPIPYYRLLLDQASTDTQALAHQLDQALCQSPHYQQSRLLGQLASAQVQVHANASDLLTQQYLQAGKTWGDIKYSVLATILIRDEALSSGH